MENMNTFKVTFFEKFNIFSVETFHNVINQGEFAKLLAKRIVAYELDPFVRVVNSEEQDYTFIANHFLKEDLNELENGYASKWYDNL